jgi:two-component system chemotaxis response regulator CheV
MSGVLEGVNQRTQLVGQNRLELLLFHLGGRQLFGINVFKVREVIPCPAITRHPNASPMVRGIANIRGRTISMIDMSLALGGPPIPDVESAFVIVTEFNRSVQGFLVRAVDRILNINWEAMVPPPRGIARTCYLTAVTKVDDYLVEIVDVEKVLSEVTGIDETLSPEVKASASGHEETYRVLVADDSSVARRQVQRALQQVGVECVLVRDGREALTQLQAWAEQGNLTQEIDMVISDIEMPEMDGYTLTAEIRKDPALKGLYVMLHSSLSGVFNNAAVQKVGANDWLPKFQADELATKVLSHIRGAPVDVAANA